MAHVCVRRRGRPAGTGHRPGVVEARTRNDNLTTEDTEDRRLKNSKFRIWNLEFGIWGMWTWFHEFRIPNSEFQIRLLRLLRVNQADGLLARRDTFLMHVNDLLKIAVESGASDLHLKVGG